MFEWGKNAGEGQEERERKRGTGRSAHILTLKERPPFLLREERLITKLLNISYAFGLSMLAVDAVGGRGVQAGEEEEGGKGR